MVKAILALKIKTIVIDLSNTFLSMASLTMKTVENIDESKFRSSIISLANCHNETAIKSEYIKAMNSQINLFSDLLRLQCDNCRNTNG